MPLDRPLLALALVLTSATVRAEELSAPTGDVVLTVTGDIGATNGDGAARFDRPMLEAMGGETVTTSTLWTEGVPSFTGVSLHTLLDRLGVVDGTLVATALNDYAVEIPVSDAVEGGPIIAYAMDGQPMSVRDKGPLWIIYPFDADPSYRTEVIYSRSIWQVDRIEVEAAP